MTSRLNVHQCNEITAEVQSFKWGCSLTILISHEPPGSGHIHTHQTEVCMMLHCKPEWAQKIADAINADPQPFVIHPVVDENIRRQSDAT